MRVPILIAVTSLLLPALSGCTKALVEHANKEEVRENRVAAPERAWRVEDRLVICLSGWPATRGRDAKAVSFHVRLQLPRPDPRAGSVGTPDLPVARHIRLTSDEIAADCPDMPADARPVPVRHLRAGDPDTPPPNANGRPLAGLAGGAGAALFAVPVEGEPPAVALLYRDEAGLFGGARLAWIDPGSGSYRPNRGAFAALPLTVAGDLALLAGGIALVAVLFILAGAAGG